MKQLVTWLMITMALSGALWAAAAQKNKVDVQAPPPAMVNPDPFGVQAPAPAPTPPPPVIVETTPAPKPQTMTEWIVANILPMVLAALGVSVSPQLLLILQKVLGFVGVKVEERLRAKLNDVVKNGISTAAADGATSRDDFINRVFQYVREHAGDTMKKLGVNPDGPTALSAVKGIMDRIFQNGETQIMPPSAVGPAEDRVAALERQLEALLAAQGKANPQPFQGGTT